MFLKRLTSSTQRFIGFSLLIFTCMMYLARSRQPPLYPEPHQLFTGMCNDTASGVALPKDLPVIYFITPTFTRREQVAELTRLAQTLLHVKNLVWIVAEDSHHCSPLVEGILRRYGIPYVHLISPIPELYKSLTYKPRGVSSRNAALKWILRDPNRPDGVFYFGDDDNTYDLRLFDEIRWTKKVSMFPVGLIGIQGISSPIVKDGQVIGFTDPWFEYRKFPVDMAGFAVSTRLMREKEGKMPFQAGHEEDQFLRSLEIEMPDIEPKAGGCTEVLVWHTKTISTSKPTVKLDPGVADSSLRALVNDIVKKGIASESEAAGKVIPVCVDKESCATIKGY